MFPLNAGTEAQVATSTGETVGEIGWETDVTEGNLHHAAADSVTQAAVNLGGQLWLQPSKVMQVLSYSCHLKSGKASPRSWTPQLTQHEWRVSAKLSDRR
jgi:hypothetical protein